MPVFPVGALSYFFYTTIALAFSVLFLNYMVAILWLPQLVVPAFLTAFITSVATILVSSLTGSGDREGNVKKQEVLATSRFVHLNAAGTAVGIITTTVDAFGRPLEPGQNGLTVMLTPIVDERELFWIWVALQLILFLWACVKIKQGSALLHKTAVDTSDELHRVGQSSLTLLVIWIVTCLSWRPVDGSEMIATGGSALLYVGFVLFAVRYGVRALVRLFQALVSGISAFGLSLLGLLLSRKTWLVVLILCAIAALAILVGYAVFLILLATFGFLQFILNGQSLDTFWAWFARESILAFAPMGAAFFIVLASALFAAITQIQIRPIRFSVVSSFVSAAVSSFALLVRKHTRFLVSALALGLVIWLSYLAISLIQASGNREPVIVVVSPPTSIVPASVPIQFLSTTIAVEPVQLCAPVLSGISWAYERDDTLSIGLGECRPPQLGDGQAIIVIALSSNGRNQDDEEARAFRRLQNASDWLANSTPQEAEIFLLNLGMGTNPNSHTELSRALGLSLSERPLLALVVTSSAGGETNWSEAMKLLNEQLPQTWPALHDSFSQFDLSRMQRAARVRRKN